MFDSLTRIRTNENIKEFLAELGFEPEVLARTTNDLPIWGVGLGGKKLPAIFFKSGSHADEIGGIYGALNVLKDLRCEHRVYVVPCANPFGFEGYNRCLSYAVGKSVEVHSNEEADSILRAHSHPIFESEDFALFVLREIGVATLDERKTGASFVERWALNELLAKRKDLLPALVNRHIYFPPEVLHDDGIDPYDHGIKTAYVNWEGWVGNTNRFYDRVDAPVETACVRTLIDRLRPAMVIDMHESGGKSGYPTTGHYLVLPPRWPLHDSRLEYRIAERMIEATRRLGFMPLTKAELQAGWINPGLANLGEEFPADGVLRSDQRPVVPFYIWGERCQVSIVTETGMAQSLTDRIQIQTAAVQAAIDAFCEAFA